MPAGRILYRSFYWKCLQFVSSFVCNVLVTRALQAAVSAEFYYLLYLLSLCIFVFTMGLDIGISYFLSRKAISPVKVGRLILFVVVPALLLSLPALAAWYHPVVFAGHARVRLLVFAGLYIAGGLLSALSGTIFTVYGRNDFPAIIAFVFNIVTAVLCWAGTRVYMGAPLADWLFEIWFVFFFLQGLLLFLLADRRYGLLRRGSVDEGAAGLRELFNFSLGAFTVNLLFFLASRISLYLLPLRIGAAARGNYIQAYKLVEYMGLVMSFLYYPLVALVAGTGSERMKSQVLVLVRLSNTFVIVCSLFVMLAGARLFPFLFGPSFDGMYGIFIWFIPGLFAVCSSPFFTAWFYGSGHIRINAVSASIQLSVMIAGFFVLPAGWGTALAFSLAGLLALGYDLSAFRRYHGYTLRDVLWVRRSDLEQVLGFLRGLPLFSGRQQGQ